MSGNLYCYSLCLLSKSFGRLQASVTCCIQVICSSFINRLFLSLLLPADLSTAGLSRCGFHRCHLVIKRGFFSQVDLELSFRYLQPPLVFSLYQAFHWSVPDDLFIVHPDWFAERQMCSCCNSQKGRVLLRFGCVWGFPWASGWWLWGQDAGLDGLLVSTCKTLHTRLCMVFADALNQLNVSTCIILCTGLCRCYQSADQSYL